MSGTSTATHVTSVNLPRNVAQTFDCTKQIGSEVHLQKSGAAKYDWNCNIWLKDLLFLIIFFISAFLQNCTSELFLAKRVRLISSVLRGSQRWFHVCIFSRFMGLCLLFAYLPFIIQCLFTVSTIDRVVNYRVCQLMLLLPAPSGNKRGSLAARMSHNL